MTLATYWQVGSHEFLNYDDPDYVTENPHIVGGITLSNVLWAFSSSYAANWHPVTWLSHMVDLQLYGMNPCGHHLTSLFIHTLSTVLLFLLLFRLTQAKWQSSFVAALFALHPMHVESVAWVAERKDVLCALFWFLTLLAYRANVVRRRPALYLLTLFFFVLGLMSKPMMVTVPLVMLLLDYWPLSRYGSCDLTTVDRQRPATLRLLGANVREKIPFFVCSFFSSAVTIFAQHKGGATGSFDTVRTHFGTCIENVVVGYVRYLSKTFWPKDLAIFYPFSLSISPWQVAYSLVILGSVTAAVIWGGRKYPFLIVGWSWFLITLLPVIGIVQVGSQSMADRYSYLPLVGLFIMVAWGGGRQLPGGLPWGSGSLRSSLLQ